MDIGIICREKVGRQGSREGIQPLIEHIINLYISKSKPQLTNYKYNLLPPPLAYSVYHLQRNDQEIVNEVFI